MRLLSALCPFRGLLIFRRRQYGSLYRRPSDRSRVVSLHNLRSLGELLVGGAPIVEVAVVSVAHGLDLRRIGVEEDLATRAILPPGRERDPRGVSGREAVRVRAGLHVSPSPSDC